MIKHSNHATKKISKKLSLELKETTENGNEPSRKDSQKPLKVEKDPSEKNSIEQRVQLSPCFSFWVYYFLVDLLLTLFVAERIL